MPSNLNNALNGKSSGSSNNGNNGFTDFASIEKANKQMYGMRQKYEQMLDKLVKQHDLQRYKDAIETAKKQGKDTQKLEADLQKKIQQLEERAIAGTLAYRNNMLKKASATKKVALIKDQKEAMRIARQEYQEKYELEWSLASGSERAKLTRAKNAYMKQSFAQEQKLREDQRKLEESNDFKSVKAATKKIEQFMSGAVKKGDLSIVGALGNISIQSIADSFEDRANRAQEEIEELDKEIDELKESGQDLAASQLEQQKKQLQNQQAFNKTMSSALSSITDSYKSSFAKAEKMLSDYKGHIDARLQGSGLDYNSVNDLISTNLAISPFVQTQKVLENMRTLTDQGIAYNLEQRAFLSTISDKIANTFDAFDSNLSRLIRLQQADTTAARLGMEASLTKFFNSMFQDSSYLSNVYDTVSAAIIDANAVLDRNASAEFEYVVQKWLGSLSSLGISDAAVGSIASGINMLATGDVQGLSSNNPLQTLFAMSASNAGLNYADLLLNGLNANNTNKLLESMVTYLKDIAENSENQVVRAAYGDIFNLTQSDFRAISNLTSSDIANISSQTMSYSGLMNEVNNQLAQVINRTSLSEMMSNLYNNAVFGVAQDQVNNPAIYAMNKMLDFMDNSGITINIPAISVMGNMVDLNASVNQLLRLGVGLSGAFSLMGNILGGLGAGGGLNLNAWNATEYTQRGSGMSASMDTLIGGTSSSTYVTTGSSEDMKSSALASATDDAQNTSKITNKNVETEKTFDDFYKAVVGESAESFISTRDLRMSFINDNSLKVSDSVLFNRFESLFGRSSLVMDSGRLKVSDSSITKYETSTGELRVSDSGMGSLFSNLTSALSVTKVRAADSSGLVVHVKNAADIRSTNNQQVSLAAGTTVSIDKESLKQAFIEAMGGSANSPVGVPQKTIQDLINKIMTGSIQIEPSTTSRDMPVRINSVSPTAQFNIRS